MVKKSLGTFAAAVVFSSAGWCVSPTFAADAPSDQLARLAMLNPGSSTHALQSELRELATSTQQSYESVLAQALAEGEQSYADGHSELAAGAVSADSGDLSASPMSSGGGGGYDIVLGNGRRKGDIFYHPSSTLGVNHGHVGLYFGPKRITEAPGSGKLSRVMPARDRMVPSGTKKMKVTATLAKRQTATNWSMNRLHLPYNQYFFNNRTVESIRYNCSQFVWAAYMKTSIDLDSNGGLGVYPRDITDHNRVTTYITLT